MASPSPVRKQTGEPRSSTGSPGPSRNAPSEARRHESTVPVTEEFYRRRIDPLVIIRVLGYASIVCYLTLVFLSKRSNNMRSPFYVTFTKVHEQVTELYLVVLDLYKRCPAVAGTIKKLRFELPYFMKLFSLYVPKYEREIMYLTSFNTLNNWVSLFVILSSVFLIELLVTVVDNLIVSYRARNSPKYCANTVTPAEFHNKAFTEEQVKKLLHSKEYLELKKARHGMGPEAWNWQLRETLARSAYPTKSQNGSRDDDLDSD